MVLLRFLAADYESEVRFSKFKMADPIWQTNCFLILQIYNFSDLLETRYSGVFGVADYEFEVSSKKFKMADPTWQTNFF